MNRTPRWTALTFVLHTGFMEEAALRSLSDEALIALIEAFDASVLDASVLDAALDELFERMRAEAPPHKRAYVEAVIERLRWTFNQDDEEGPNSGVREPRRTPPGLDGSAISLAS